MSVCQNEYLSQIFQSCNQNGIKCQMYKSHLYVHIHVSPKNLYMYIKYHIQFIYVY